MRPSVSTASNCLSAASALIRAGRFGDGPAGPMPAGLPAAMSRAPRGQDSLNDVVDRLGLASCTPPGLRVGLGAFE